MLEAAFLKEYVYLFVLLVRLLPNPPPSACKASAIGLIESKGARVLIHRQSIQSNMTRASQR